MLVTYRDLPGAGQPPRALDELDAVLLEQAGHPAGECLDHAATAGHHRGVVDLGFAHLDPEVVGFADLLQNVRRAQHRLGGDAGVVQAPAADLILFDDCRRHPELSGPDGGHVTARS